MTVKQRIDPKYKIDKIDEGSFISLASRVKDATYGLPEDQLTPTQKRLVKKYERFFENDNGYIKLKKAGRRNPITNKDKLLQKIKAAGRQGLKLSSLTQPELSILYPMYQANIVRNDNGRVRIATSKDTDYYVTPNHSATPEGFRNHQKQRVNDHVQMFQGEVTGKNFRLLKSDLAPKETMSFLGKLVLMRTKRDGKNFDVHFNGNATLAMDGRKNLWAVGSDAIISDIKRPKKDAGLDYIGRLYQIDYVTAKKHIEGGEVVHFYHKLGEVTGDTPRLYIDHDGFPVIIGGGYDVWDVGIVN